MKLATYKDGSRDGQLVVVSRDLAMAHHATGIASRLQQVLDDWNFIAPQLQDLYTTLNQGKARHAFAFEPRQCMAPLPRAYQWVDADAYATPTAAHPAVADGAAAPPAGPPQLQQGSGDDLLGPCDDAWFGSAAWGIDLAPGLAVVTGDLAMGASPEQGLDAVRLLMLTNAWTLRHLPAAGQAGADALVDGPLQRRPAAACAPVAVTPDELGEAWRGGRLQAQLLVQAQGRRLGLLPTGDAALRHPFGTLIAHLARTRNLRAGTVLAAGPVRSADANAGHACLADKAAAPAAPPDGPSATVGLALGDKVRLDLTGSDGQSVFGAIAQRVVGPGMDAPPPPPDEPTPPAQAHRDADTDPTPHDAAT